MNKIWIFLLVLLNVLYIGTYFGIMRYNVKYIDYLNIGVQLFICLFLISRNRFFTGLFLCLYCLIFKLMSFKYIKCIFAIQKNLQILMQIVQ
jgi:hypothetical protein